MGAGASAADVGNSIGNVGAAYSGYASKAQELGVNGELIMELLADGGIDDALNDIGVTNSLQRRRLKLEATKQMEGESGSSSPGNSVPRSGHGGSGNGGKNGNITSNDNLATNGLTVMTTTAMAEAVPMGQIHSQHHGIHSQMQTAPTIIIQNQGGIPSSSPQVRTYNNSPMANRPPPQRHPAQMQFTPGGSRMMATPRTPSALPAGLSLSGRILLGLGWDPAENSSGAVTDAQDEDHMDLDVGVVLFGQVMYLLLAFLLR